MRNEKFNKSLGETMQYFRLKANMTQTDVANKMGITKMAVSNYETGTRQIYANVWHDYCKAIGVSMQEMLDYMDLH